MTPQRSTAAHASVAYFRIHDFESQAVPQQARLKAELEEAIAVAVADLEEAGRIVLDAPDGMAVVVLANPPKALALAWQAGALPGVRLAAGLAHGAVRANAGKPASVYGDALAAAHALARAAPPGGLVATRDFRAVLGRWAPGLALGLAGAGSTMDAQDRALEMFRADKASLASRRRGFLASAAVVAAVIVGTGFVMRTADAPMPVAAAPKAVAAPKPAAAAPKPAVAEPKPVVPARPATLTFDIRPGGEIYVDGALRGKSPPVKKIQLPAGRHQLEIRSGKHKPLATEIMVAEGEELAIQHSFTSPQPAKPFWQRWIDKVK